MPLLALFSSAAPPADPAPLLARLSALMARELDKAERYVMVSLTPRPQMLFGGSGAPACYAELKNVGTLSPERALDLSRTLCAELARGLGVTPDRIYIEFTSNDGAFWGWNGTTFG
jgi:phenylpyruvate tautomerase